MKTSRAIGDVDNLARSALGMAGHGSRHLHFGELNVLIAVANGAQILLAEESDNVHVR